jgi:hypothetical protein
MNEFIAPPWLSAVPDLGDRLRRFDEDLRGGDDRFLEGASTLLQSEALSRAFLRTLVHSQLECLVRALDAQVTVSRRRVWELARSPRFTLDLCLFSAEWEPGQGQALEGSPRHRAWRIFDPTSGLRARWYHQPAAARAEVFDATANLVACGERTLLPDSVWTIRANEDLVQLPPDLPPAVVLELSSAPRTTVAWTYDPVTLAPLSAFMAEPSTVKLSQAIQLLGELGCSSSVEPLTRMLQHPAHHVRWSAIQAVHQLDPAAARPLLERAVSDAHPHVRAAARRALDRLEGAPGD